MTIPAAEDIALIHALASFGAPPQLVSAETGISIYTVRTVLKGRQSNPGECRKNWPWWFDAEPQRALHAHLFVKAHRRTGEASTRAARLVEAYTTYCEVVPDPHRLLTITAAAKGLELLRDGFAVERACSSCTMRHMSFEGQTRCPVCREAAGLLCRKCLAPIPLTARTTGKRKSLCDGCAPRGRKRSAKALTGPCLAMQQGAARSTS